MNRIREIRQKRGLSVAELASRVGTSQPQLTRLETGQRRLTEDWLRRLAKALDVEPAELIASVTIAELSEEAVPYEPPETKAVTGALARRNLVFWRIESDSLEQLEIRTGAIRLFDMNAAAVGAVQTGDVVIVQCEDVRRPGRARTLVRQFVAPNLLVTNRRSGNSVVTLLNDAFEGHIRGVMVPDDEAQH